MKYEQNDFVFHKRDIRDSDKTYDTTTGTISAECKHCGGRGSYVLFGETEFVHNKARMVTIGSVSHGYNCVLVKATTEARRKARLR